MLTIAKTGRIEKEEISKNYFNKMAKTRIALIQMKMSSDLQKNMNSALKRIKEASKKKAKIICLPELFLSNYFCQKEKHSNFNLAEKIPGPTTDAFCLLAKKLKIILLLSLFEKRTSGIYHNTFVVIDEITYLPGYINAASKTGLSCHNDNFAMVASSTSIM